MCFHDLDNEMTDIFHVEESICNFLITGELKIYRSRRIFNKLTYFSSSSSSHLDSGFQFDKFEGESDLVVAVIVMMTLRDPSPSYLYCTLYII